jgi:Sec-independent protein translocase protein TatA
LALGYCFNRGAYPFWWKGKLSSIMGDFGKGLKNFKDQVKSNKEVEEKWLSQFQKNQKLQKRKLLRKRS